MTTTRHVPGIYFLKRGRLAAVNGNVGLRNINLQPELAGGLGANGPEQHRVNHPRARTHLGWLGLTGLVDVSLSVRATFVIRDGSWERRRRLTRDGSRGPGRILPANRKAEALPSRLLDTSFHAGSDPSICVLSLAHFREGRGQVVTDVHAMMSAADQRPARRAVGVTGTDGLRPHDFDGTSLNSRRHLGVAGSQKTKNSDGKQPAANSLADCHSHGHHLRRGASHESPGETSIAGTAARAEVRS